MNPQRRALLRAGSLAAALPMAAGAGSAAAASAALPSSLPSVPAGTTPDALASNQAYWQAVAAQYDTTDAIVQLDNAFWGSMARPVLRHYEQQLAMVNRDNAWYARMRFPADFEAARAAAARALGVGIDEIVLTRGATEALQVLIAGYNRLRPGDTVLYADIDYDNMITVTRWLQQRRGAQVVSIAMPEPFTHDGVIAAYVAAMERHPTLKLMLLTHVNHRNGMVLPVAEISRLARARGIDVIVDTAHGFGQLDMTIPDLQADFAGINLHKWIGAPVGVGAAYIKRGRVADIDPYMGELRGEKAGDDIRTRVHTGTVNFAAYLSLPVALDLHAQIGVANKQARLRLLRNRWVEAARAIEGIEVLASADPRLTSAIASFRLKGKTSVADSYALSKKLVQEHGIFAVPRDGLASGACVRVTPGIFTPESHLDRLVEALRKVAKG
ncbi:aminotransferase class V-fold PLP-dependent enzyme [Janthinobacterium lividum]|uniref:aminotransferase class V-fold PLP-dependent enzyme n=1 Tax=Janthinobacterium lividum TaxID=29581 RepID=UPI000874E1ED|nr:aminotransferase class V-fold PLP-dependent enzyme [Janthinobacterium lividum]MCC7715482.1 aminotransferase class V-fold PLP-dependent enzyme [Janthinobacterium lividum]OEZ59442.1 isopenicillin N epimerase [Janthinobacterium lividum]WQE28490.1 aminotransferase class V-fold PLP-dependent enzyme [Janthinobacterium lividum]STQ99435.1 Isopenicillin N epimerase [Janthinobacterium lividum]